MFKGIHNLLGNCGLRWVDEAVGFGHAGHFHGFAIPIDGFSKAQCDDASESDLGEVAAEVEIRKHFGTAEAGVHPFVEVAVDARKGFGNLFGEWVIAFSDKAFVAVHHDITIGIPESALQLAFFTDEQATGSLQAAKGCAMSCGGCFRGHVTAGVEMHFHRWTRATGREVVGHGAGFRETLFSQFRAADFNPVRIEKSESPHGQVEGMAAKIRDRSTAEVIPTAPIERVIDTGFVGPLRSRAEPCFPVEACGNRVAAIRTLHAARPAMGRVPDVNFGDGAKHVRLDEFHATAKVARRAALVAGLGDDLGVFGEVSELAGFRERVGEGFFAIDVFASLDGVLANPGVPVVGCGDDDCIQLLFFFQHLAVVAVVHGLGYRVAVALARISDLAGIHIAEGCDLVSELDGSADMALDLVAHADESDVELVARFFGRRSEQRARLETQRTGGKSSGFKECAAGEVRVIFHILVFAFWMKSVERAGGRTGGRGKES